MAYATDAVTTVQPHLFDSKRPYQVLFTLLKNVRPLWGFSGSSVKLSSDPIIPLAGAVIRLESDDGWNTCGAWDQCGALRALETGAAKTFSNISD